MAEFRVYFLNNQDHIVLGETLDVFDLEAAIQAAYRPATIIRVSRPAGSRSGRAIAGSTQAEISDRPDACVRRRHGDAAVSRDLGSLGARVMPQRSAASAPKPRECPAAKIPLASGRCH
jgi:hypothetical protein